MQKTITYQGYKLNIKTEQVDVSDVTKKARGSYRAIIAINTGKQTQYFSVPGFSKTDKEAMEAGVKLAKTKIDRGLVTFS